MTDIPLPSRGSTNWMDWAGEQEAASDEVRERLGAARSLDSFRAGTDPDHTNAFTAAATWSSANRAPIHVPPSPVSESTAYTTSAPIVLDRNSAFVCDFNPKYGPASVTNDAAAIIRPTATFPNNRGLFEIGGNGRSITLRGLVLHGNDHGAGVVGIKFPGATGNPDLGTILQDLAILNFSSHGISGGARVVFMQHVYSRHNGGYGIDMSSAWYDSRAMWVYCGYNRLGGLNIEAGGNVTFFQSRFERSGQTYVDPQNATSASTWTTTSPGIRIRGGGGNTFIQCDTDANNGPGLDCQVPSSSGSVSLYTFMGCNFARDGQGTGKTVDTTSAGVKVRGSGDIWAGGKPVSRIRFTDCSVTYGVSNDDGDTSFPSNPSRGLWLENSELCYWSGGSIFGSSTAAYFGGGAADAQNWRPWFSLPEQGVMQPAYPETTPFQITGMLRENGSLQRWNGTAWVTV